MSLKSSPITQIPEDTARIAKAAFPKSNRYLILRDTFGDLFDATDFKHLFSNEGKPASDPARLAIITILQFAEQLSDERMSDAVRSRIDLKYLLALALDDPGFDSSVLCEFRARLIQGNAELILFEKLLERFRAHKLLRERGKQRTDSTHVLAAVHALKRLSCAGQAFRNALNVLATVAPDWSLEHTKPEWIERYGKPFEVEHTISESKKAERAALERAVAADGLFLLEAVFATPCLGLKTCLLFMCCGVFGFRILLGRTMQLCAFALMKKSLQHVVSSTHRLILMRDSAANVQRTGWAIKHI